MTDLVERLRAALDETERVALDAGASFLGTSGRTWRRDLISCVVDADGRLIVYGEGTPTSAQADHIALHDPERELRMVAAHRKILDLHHDVEHPEYPDCCAECGDTYPCATVLTLANALQVEA